MKTDVNTQLDEVMREVQRTFDALTKARARVSRSKRPDSLENARTLARLAEEEYRRAADRRDELVQVRNARLTQAGDPRGAAWSSPDGVRAPALSGDRLARKPPGKEVASPWHVPVYVQGMVSSDRKVITIFVRTVDGDFAERETGLTDVIRREVDDALVGAFAQAERNHRS